MKNKADGNFIVNCGFCWGILGDGSFIVEQARANRFLKRVQTIPDSPSERALNLKPTRRLGEQDIIILGTGDRLGIITLTADAKAIKAALVQGVDFDVFVHSPCPLTGQ